jgi:hypothetical protein
MTRAIERAPSAEPDPHEDLWEDQHGGETPDHATAQALRLAHRAAEKFPELKERYKSFAGPAAIASGALIVMASVAVARRARRGQKPEEILAQITSEEIENAATVTSRQNHWWRMIARIATRRRRANEHNTPS